MTQGNPPGAAAQSFPCKNCGAKLQFDAGAGAMTCPFCGHKQAVEQPAAPAQPAAQQGWGPAVQPPGGIREIPLEEGFRLAQKGLGVQVTTVGCKECGATVNVGEGERTTKCAFCGSGQVLAQGTNETAIRPESLIPFGITKEAANAKFGEWLRGLWFRPSDLKHMAKVQEMGGLYVPYWTFDSQVVSQWHAERGWHYYVTETYTTVENGQTVTKTRQVQHTRWEPASGQRQDFFDDVLVCAGKGLPSELVEKFSTFDTSKLVPYRPEYLSGWRAEAYSLDLMPGWSVAQDKIARVQEGRCGSDVGGDTHRNLSVNNQFYSVTFKHILLPIWIAAYRYNGKVFRFLVNGQTGEVVGKAPWSFWKIFFFVSAIVAVIATIIAIWASQQEPRHAPQPTPTAVVTAAPVPTDTATGASTGLAPAKPTGLAKPTTAPTSPSLKPVKKR